MSIEFFLEDYEYVYKALKKHPSFQVNRSIFEFEKLYEELKVTILDFDSFINALTELTVLFEDGHTNIEIPYTVEDECLKIPCEWKDNRLILIDKYEDIEAGTELVAIEGVRTEQLIQWASKRIPHENLFLVKSRMVEYPYMNYHMFSKMNLVQLFGDKRVYEITFRINGEEKVRQCEPVKYDGFVDFCQDDFVYYEIQGERAVLHLDECICNEQYFKTLQELAVCCNEKKIQTLELDLSRNKGGSSAVIDAFIQYVNVDSFRRYEMVDYSSGTSQIVSSRTAIVINQKRELLFPETIICRVSNTTFSSARTFAVTLKDNGIARIVGTPTGGKPCSYGMPKRDVTPNSKIRFRVSGALFLRPDNTKDCEIALYPEYA